jgi:DNA topoisomerase-3
MRASGLGTPATRASIIETLISRAYVERSKKALIATDKGMRLIDAVHADVKSPAMTGRWEAKLQRLQQGEGDLAQFMQGIEAYVRKVIGKMDSQQVVETRKPTPPEKLGELLRDSFGFEDFRPFQEAVCQAITRGSDALLVMPTGAGKSLCYQLPGIARAGTTLIISPLIALMEDQVASLKQFGFNAERIHSGRSRLGYSYLGDRSVSLP